MLLAARAVPSSEKQGYDASKESLGVKISRQNLLFFLLRFEPPFWWGSSVCSFYFLEHDPLTKDLFG